MSTNESKHVSTRINPHLINSFNSVTYKHAPALFYWSVASPNMRCSLDAKLLNQPFSAACEVPPGMALRRLTGVFSIWCHINHRHTLHPPIRHCSSYVPPHPRARHRPWSHEGSYKWPHVHTMVAALFERAHVKRLRATTPGHYACHTAPATGINNSSFDVILMGVSCWLPADRSGRKHTRTHTQLAAVAYPVIL